jgi:hypothetical protein
MTIVLVAGIPLCRAALNGAISSPMVEMGLRSMAEQLEDKSLEPPENGRAPDAIVSPNALERPLPSFTTPFFCPPFFCLLLASPLAPQK